RHLQLGQRGVRFFDQFRRDQVVWINVIAAEKSGEDDIAPYGFTGAPGHKVVRHDPEEWPQLKNVPELLSQNRDTGVRPCDRVTLARDGLDQRRLSASVGTENRNVLSSVDPKIEIVKNGFGPASDLNVA